MINSDMLYLCNEVRDVLVKMEEERKNVPSEYVLAYRLAFDRLTEAEALLFLATGVQA